MPGVQALPGLWEGHAPLLEIPSAKALHAAAQMNVVEIHTWNSVRQKVDKPDRMIFDLDPGDGVEFGAVREGAQLMRALLDELGLRAWLKTSGGKGLHVVVPLSPRLDYDAVKDFSQAVVRHLAATIPQRFVAKSGPSNRVGRIFVDYLRNGFNATTAAAFSARARPGLGVSMPVAWDELPELKGGAQWTIADARDRMSFQAADPWADYWTCRQTLTAARKAPAGRRRTPLERRASAARRHRRRGRGRRHPPRGTAAGIGAGAHQREAVAERVGVELELRLRFARGDEILEVGQHALRLRLHRREDFFSTSRPAARVPRTCAPGAGATPRIPVGQPVENDARGLQVSLPSRNTDSGRMPCRLMNVSALRPRRWLSITEAGRRR